MAEFNPTTSDPLDTQFISGVKPPTHNPLSNVDQAIKYSHLFPQLDIIASSRHIKTLFKIPFSKEPFSLAVHRIGKTLIFDDFFLNLNSQSNSTQPEPTVEPKNESLKRKGARISRLSSLPELTSDKQIKNVLNLDTIPTTKQELIPFKPELNQSIVPITHLRHKVRQRRYSEGSSDNWNQSKISSPSLILSSIPQPLSLTTSSGMSVSYGPCVRDILWRFEDYSMLLGSDLPIFGMGTYPAVSLYIQEGSVPINVLTGIDIWLDNLMNNVPEVLMAYRVENVIRNYEVLELDTIPTLPNSKFSPDLISNICTNILHFLKSNCTKEGHTYWLLRERGEDIIKLYDLTSLVDIKMGLDVPHRFENPFVDPVALLFYKVATQMYRKSSPRMETYPEVLGTIKYMLEQVIRLLRRAERNSKLELYAFQVLTDIFLGIDFIQEMLTPELELEPVKTSAKNRKKKTKKGAKCETVPKHSLEKESKFLVPISTGTNQHIYWPIDNLTSEEEYGTIQRDLPPPIKLGSNEERARIAIEYIIASLELTNKFPNETEIIGTYVNEMMTKAAACFYIISQSYFSLKKLGKAMKYANYGLKTIIPISERKSSSLVSLLKYSILELLGDTLCLLGKSKDIPAHEKEFFENDPELKPILSLSSDRIEFDSFVPPAIISSNLVDNILNSIDCYLFIEKNSSRFQFLIHPLSKRLGNAYNEIGLLGMDSIMNQNELSSTTKLNLAKSAFTYFQNSIHYFNQSGDVLNLVLVHSNSGRLMRICAFHLSANQITGETEFSPQIQEFCNEAIAAYQSGIKLLSNGDYTELCNNLKFDLCNIKLQLINLMIGQEMKQELSQLLVSSISLLEELDVPEFERQNEVIFSLSLAYYYFGIIEREHLKDFIRNSDEKTRNYMLLSEKYFLKSNHILETKCPPTLRVLVQKSKNLIELYDLIILNTLSSKLNLKQKQISNALKYIIELFSIFLTNIPECNHDNDSLLELSDFGAQSVRKLRSLVQVMIKQFGTNSNLTKDLLKLQEYLKRFQGFTIFENMINFDTSLLTQIQSACVSINIQFS